MHIRSLSKEYMTDLGLYNYIKKELAEGKNKEQITTNLSQGGGWSQVDIDAAFIDVESGKVPDIYQGQSINDDVMITTYYFPVVTMILILVNVCAFVVGQVIVPIAPSTDVQVISQCISSNFPDCTINTASAERQCKNNIIEISKKCFPSRTFYFEYAFVPYLFGQGITLWSIITAMFLHANTSHLVGNMIALLIVGAFVETRIGRKKFIVFYFLVGLCSNIIYFIFNQNSMVPLLGASGAIFGLIGANLVLDFYRTRSERVPHFFGITLRGLSAKFLIIAFFLQIWSLTFSAAPGNSNNVAYLAHVGGFISGFLFIFFFKDKQDVYNPKPIR